MANQQTLHDRIAAHPGIAHSEWVASNPGATLREIDMMRKRFERIGQTMLEDWNRHRVGSSSRARYAIPGEPDYQDDDNI